MLTRYHVVSPTRPALASEASSWMKGFVFWLHFHRSLFSRIQSTVTQYCVNKGLTPDTWQSFIWTIAMAKGSGLGGWDWGDWVKATVFGIGCMDFLQTVHRFVDNLNTSKDMEVYFQWNWYSGSGVNWWKFQHVKITVPFILTQP